MPATPARLERLTMLAVLMAAMSTTGYVGWRIAADRQLGAARPTVERLQPGERVPLPAVDFGAAENTVLLVLSTKCQYCASSFPFYRHLIETRTRGTRVVAVGSESADVISTYLATHQIAIDQVATATPQTLRVPTVPTIILADRNGTVRKMWRGRLRPDGERDVAASLASTQ